MCRRNVQTPILKRLCLFSQRAFWSCKVFFFLNYNQRLILTTKFVNQIKHAQKKKTIECFNVLSDVTDLIDVILYYLCID